MAIDFKQAFSGFANASPDGTLPKINAHEGPVEKGGGGKDGSYDLRVVSTELFVSHYNNNTHSFKAVVEVISCDNGRFKPGTQASIVVHKVLDADGGTKGLKAYDLAKAWGNVKGFLAAALSSKFGEDISPHDLDCGGSDWLDIIESACKVPETCAGGCLRVQVNSAKAESSGNHFAKMAFATIPMAGQKAA